jgi:mannose-6-phosphate isomerase
LQTDRNAYSAEIDAYRVDPVPIRLQCGAQHYPWGDYDTIPALLGIANPSREPFAELWIGAHPDLPAMALLGDARIGLDVLLQRAAEEVLGSWATLRYSGRLPFLLKVLTARQPLSIQAHPSSAQAAEGFAREDRLGVPRDDPRRNYHDPYHKPELICALDDFYALRGFRPLEDIAALPQRVPELAPPAARFEATEASLRSLYRHLMTMPQEQVDALLNPLIERLRKTDWQEDAPEYWVLEADRDFSLQGHRDRGIFSVFLLNLVHLRPGEAMYLPAGELHAYLRGVGIEIMANSNNVLRGGLTGKHIDVEELLSILKLGSGTPQVLRPQPVADGLETYPGPAEEFQLSRLSLPAGGEYRGERGHPMRLAVVLEGAARVVHRRGRLAVGRGDVFLVPYGIDYAIRAESRTRMFQGSVPN